MKRSLVSMTLAVWAGSGCTVGPNYVAPDLSTPDVWYQTAAAGLSEGDAALQTWWGVFDDALLAELIEEAQANNRDLHASYYRILQARAQIGIEESAGRPQVGVNAQVARAKPSESLTGIEDASTPASATLGATWEIDLFGRIRRSVEAADAQYEARIEDYRDLLVTLLADVAINYIDARSLQLRLDYARANIVAQQESLELTRDRFAAGLTSGLDVAQAESNLATSESEVPRLRAAREAALNRLAVLVGRTPGELHERMKSKTAIPTPPETVARGLPAELLRQRPDVRAAERRLAAQTARIGIATADLYPRLSLSGFFGGDALDVDDLGTGRSATWSIGLPVQWAIFQGGRIRAQIRSEEAATDAAFKSYEQAVLLAIEDVETSVALFANEQERKVKLEAAVVATERSVELVRTQYLAGLTNFQNVLDSQRSLFRLQDQLAESEGLRVQNLVDIYRALGGGWDTRDVDVFAPAGLETSRSPHRGEGGS